MVANPFCLAVKSGCLVNSGHLSKNMKRHQDSKKSDTFCSATVGNYSVPNFHLCHLIKVCNVKHPNRIFSFWFLRNLCFNRLTNLILASHLYAFWLKSNISEYSSPRHVLHSTGKKVIYIPSPEYIITNHISVLRKNTEHSEDF